MAKTNEELLKEASNVGKILHSPFMLAVLVRELAARLKEVEDK